MKADVFTLFPHWFEWFRTQRHVENALALWHELSAIDFRQHTPLKWGHQSGQLYQRLGEKLIQLVGVVVDPGNQVTRLVLIEEIYRQLLQFGE